MFLRFAICLAPLILTGIILMLVATETIDSNAAEGSAAFGCILLILGALISGFFVSRLVYRNIVEPKWWKILATILVFITVGIGYLGIGLFGGCLLLVAGSSL